MDQQQEAWTSVLLASLRAENTQLWEIVQVVATDDTTYYDDDGNEHCLFCPGKTDNEEYQHTSGCIVTRARVLVEQARIGKEYA